MMGGRLLRNRLDKPGGKMSLRRIVGPTIATVLIVLVVSVSVVSAGWVQCRSDPVVTLSNGLTLDLSADIGVPLWEVEQVDYILHVPQGVNLVTSIATPSWPTTIETFTLYDDAPPGEYHSETIVYTTGDNIPVTAHTILLSALGLQLDAVSVPGFEGQVLHAYVNVP
jgi:hypothetical protein